MLATIVSIICWFSRLCPCGLFLLLCALGWPGEVCGAEAERDSFEPTKWLELGEEEYSKWLGSVGTNQTADFVLLYYDPGVKVVPPGEGEASKREPNFFGEPLTKGITLLTEQGRSRVGNLKVISAVNQGSEVLIFQDPGELPGLDLSYGSLYLKKFGSGSAGPFRLVTTNGRVACDGTELHMRVTATNTEVRLIDGKATLFSAGGPPGITYTTNLEAGDLGTLVFGKPPTRTTNAIEAINQIIQWVLYYPGILDIHELPDDLTNTPGLQASVTNYMAGDILRAVALYRNNAAASESEIIYAAALQLAHGQVSQAEELLDQMSNRARAQPAATNVSELSRALRQLIATVKFQTFEPRPQPRTATEWLAESYYQQSLVTVTATNYSGEVEALRTSRLQPQLWETNYYRPSDSNLDKALKAVEGALKKDPTFGFALARKAELQFSFGRLKQARATLEKVLGSPGRSVRPPRGAQPSPGVSPRNAQAIALRGFLFAAGNNIHEATNYFAQALAVDGTLGNAWLGLGLSHIRRGNLKAGLQFLKIAVAQEPQRSILRSYLAKAYELQSYLGPEPERAGYATHTGEEIGRARTLDKRDPTPWLYSALMLHSSNQVNAAVGDLEHSIELNDNRAVYRSRLLLDQDRAVRSANLAAIYRDADLVDVSVREAGKAVSYDYANHAAHLFLANSYDALRDSRSIILRYETAAISEYLLANLLAPVGAGSLSQYISNQEYSKLFERDGLRFGSATSYSSSGDWLQTASQFGTFGRSAYSMDFAYQSHPGQRANEDSVQRTIDARIKQQLSDQDTVYLETIFSNYEAGDVFDYPDPAQAQMRKRVQEIQEPSLLLGFHREWQPGVHTLFLGSRLSDVQRFDNYLRSALSFVRDPTNPGQRQFEKEVVFINNYRNALEIYGAEIQQIFQQHNASTIVGAAYQHGAFETKNQMNSTADNSEITAPQNISTSMDRISAYGYQTWQIATPLQITAGCAYDHLKYPFNIRFPPVVDSQNSVGKFSPKGGFVCTIGETTTWRGGYSRSIGGVSFEQSYRLEPSQVSGFNQAYRDLRPEYFGGPSTAPTQEVWSLEIDRKLGRRTFLGAHAELVGAKEIQANGVFDRFPDQSRPSISAIRRDLTFQEKSLRITLNQLLGRDWSFGATYQVRVASAKDAHLDFEAVKLSFRAELQEADFDIVYNHPCGFYMKGYALWQTQTYQDISLPLRIDRIEDAWQFNFLCGYRFARRRAEIQIGLLNLTGQSPRFVPLTQFTELPPARTLALNFTFAF